MEYGEIEIWHPGLKYDQTFVYQSHSRSISDLVFYFAKCFRQFCKRATYYQLLFCRRQHRALQIDVSTGPFKSTSVHGPKKHRKCGTLQIDGITL